MDHLEANGFMNPTQHGFCSKHSTVTQLLSYYDSVLTILEAGGRADTIYLDFAKVDHDILLKTLRRYTTWESKAESIGR